MKGFIPEICTTTKFNPTVTIDESLVINHSQLIKNVQAKYYNNKFFPDIGNQKKYNEFRFTSWGGKKCAIQNPENTGSIFLFAGFNDNGKHRILCWVTTSLEEENLIENWLHEDVYPGEFIGFFQHEYKRAPKSIIDNIPVEWFKEFPKGAEIFSFVEKIIPTDLYGNDVDKLLIRRRTVEYEIFQTIEEARFEEYKKQITGIKKLIEVANKLTNSRKSRSGNSLEYNLVSIFKFQKLQFERHVITENRKEADFLFPSKSAYHNRSFPAERLNMLGSKTCCKDRWRQIVTEANKIRLKHLFTLQEGVSSHQLQEMADNGIVLVVPSNLKPKYPSEWRNKILDLSSFIKLRKRQEHLSQCTI